jgi:hypothetical protein
MEQVIFNMFLRNSKHILAQKKTLSSQILCNKNLDYDKSKFGPLI